MMEVKTDIGTQNAAKIRLKSRGELKQTLYGKWNCYVWHEINRQTLGHRQRRLTGLIDNISSVFHFINFLH